MQTTSKRGEVVLSSCLYTVKGLGLSSSHGGGLDMTKRLSKKMRVTKERLRNLVPAELSAILGGGDDLRGVEVFDPLASRAACPECETHSKQCLDGTKSCAFQ